MDEKIFNVIGKSVPRVDARSKVTGQALFPRDLSKPGMPHMKILFAERPFLLGAENKR
jgi:CO/xanthine dehydrogenase Mo-binding subunit